MNAQIQIANRVSLISLNAFQRDAAITQLQLLRHLLHRRINGLFHHLLGVARARIVHQTRQAFLPGQTIGGMRQIRRSVARGAGPTVVFNLQRFKQPGHHKEDNKAERQPHDHRGVLQGSDTVGHQHAQGQYPNRHRPEDAQPVRCIAIDVFQA